MKIPNKIVNINEVSTLSLAKQMNNLIDFLDYFIRETEKCCTCNGCPKHPKKEICEKIHPSQCEDCFYGDHIQCSRGRCECSCESSVETEFTPKSLADKFQDFRSKSVSGKGDKYWSGLEKIAKEHYSSNW